MVGGLGKAAVLGLEEVTDGVGGGAGLDAEGIGVGRPEAVRALRRQGQVLGDEGLALVPAKDLVARGDSRGGAGGRASQGTKDVSVVGEPAGLFVLNLVGDGDGVKLTEDGRVGYGVEEPVGGVGLSLEVGRRVATPVGILPIEELVARQGHGRDDIGLGLRGLGVGTRGLVQDQDHAVAGGHVLAGTGVDRGCCGVSGIVGAAGVLRRAVGPGKARPVRTGQLPDDGSALQADLVGDPHAILGPVGIELEVGGGDLDGLALAIDRVALGGEGPAVQDVARPGHLVLPGQGVGGPRPVAFDGVLNTRGDGAAVAVEGDGMGPGCPGGGEGETARGNG